MNRDIRIATRGSELALWQTNWVRSELEKRFPEARFETLTIKTTGDKILDVPLAKIGDKGLFTKELDTSLLKGETDFAVHSLKDLPTKLPEGLAIAAITKRWDARDVLISRNGEHLADLPDGARVATGSLRRRSQLLHYRPDLEILEIRGNLNTRFRKFDEAYWDAMILAAAGVERLGWSGRISEKISTDILLPAVGQGSLAILCREQDVAMLEFLINVEDRESMLAARAERSLMRTLEGGCQVPIGAHAVVSEKGISLAGCVCSLDGRTLVRDSTSSETHDDPENLGAVLAGKLLENGAREILREIFGKDSR
jgi:hydroxymethylbilane synthase